MAKDYSYLEGTEFVYHMAITSVHAKVLYADYHIGITCVAADNPDHCLICVRGATGAKTAGTTPIPPRVYQAIWMSLINQIETGYVRVSRLKEVILINEAKHSSKSYFHEAGFLSSESCAFGQ